MKTESININNLQRYCDSCLFRIKLGKNAQGQYIYGCGKAGKCKERSKEQNDVKM